MNPEVLRMPVSELELTVRAHNCLKADQIETVADLVTRTERELLLAPGMGKKSLEEIKEVLSRYSLRLSMKAGELHPITGETHENLRGAMRIAAYRVLRACEEDDPVKALDYSKLVVQMKHILDI
jgi:DNA-directed RNA polymerase subunit alpha